MSEAGSLDNQKYWVAGSALQKRKGYRLRCFAFSFIAGCCGVFVLAWLYLVTRILFPSIFVQSTLTVQRYTQWYSETRERICKNIFMFNTAGAFFKKSGCALGHRKAVPSVCIALDYFPEMLLHSAITPSQPTIVHVFIGLWFGWGSETYAEI
jgi:hypothetical protein